MLIKNEKFLGDVTIRNEVLARMAGAVASKCYGVVGMAAKDAKDGVVSILKANNITKGIGVSVEDGRAVIELHIIVEYGTNISTICKSIANRVRYAIAEYAGVKVKRIDIKVEGIRTE